MRLDRLDLTRYGHFTDRRIEFRAPEAGAPDLHIVYGPNEAGKSTLFSAWMDLLFGIPLRSRNDFLHPGPAMQIGALLSDGDRRADLRRLKRGSGSLLDAHGAVLPDAVLQSFLGGLSREGYSAMFSLDDETLEKGGDSILSSRGDLGEMLFAASAGLSELAPQLDGIRAELDAVYRVGARKGELHDAKKLLLDLDRERRDLEVSVTAIQKLGRAAEAAETTWREVRLHEADLARTLQDLREREAALPLRRKLNVCLAELQALDHLPDAGREDRERLDRLDRERTKIADRQSERAARMAAVEAEMQALCPDPHILTLAPRIMEAEGLRAPHDTALQDLPRRSEDVKEIDARLRAILTDLGHAGEAAAMVVPAPRMTRMRTLVGTRSGIVAALAGARTETGRAEDHLRRETDRLGASGPADDDGALSALLARLMAQQPAEAHDRARRDRDAAQGRLRMALDALRPWMGDEDTLAALPVPTDWQIAAWQQDGERLRQEELDIRRAERDLHEALAGLPKRDEAAGGITLADAAAARGRREARWADHLSRLSPVTAQEFEQALREDDRISALFADALADARRNALDAAERATREARLAATEVSLARTLSDSARLASDIAATAGLLGLSDAALPDLIRWLDLRRGALTERAALRDAEDTLVRTGEGLEKAAKALRTLLADPDAFADYEVLHARARARQDSLDARREVRRTLANAAADLHDRRKAQADAEGVLAAWRADWEAACADGPLSRYPWNDAALGDVLDLLDRLANDLHEREGLSDRITKMQANRDRFVAARDTILKDLAADMPWTGLLTRLRRAEDCARDHERLALRMAEEGRAEIDDLRRSKAVAADLDAMGVAFGCPDPATLATHLDACIRARVLRADVDDLRRDLRDRPDHEDDGNAEDIAERIGRISNDLHLARDEVDRCHALHLEARAALDAVGGDDAVARLLERRENLALETKEKAQTHLAQRFGLMAFEAALRRYRDLHRSTMLTRASEAFATLSRGAYPGLASQPDGTQDVLVALSASGRAKLAADLSKGTRFQLYLALRVAGYHELAQSRTSVPFIADDIMETFDDDRSAAAFSLLADMSRIGQVIYLTHHRHLCDIVRDVCPGANVIDLHTA